MILLESISTHRNTVSKKRLEICSKCEHYQKKTTRCDKCGCFMEFKTIMLNASCPIGKWHKED